MFHELIEEKKEETNCTYRPACCTVGKKFQLYSIIANHKCVLNDDIV